MVEFGLNSHYRLFSVADDGSQAQVAEIAVDRPAYMHSFAMTERYLVLVEFPLTVSALELKFSGKPFIQNYRWQPERGLKFHVVDKDSGAEVATAHGDAIFAFHHVNAFEDGDGLVIDMIAYPDASIIDQLYLARLRAGTPIDATGHPHPFPREAAAAARRLFVRRFRRCRWNCRASTTGLTPASPIAMSGARASSLPATFSTPSSRSTPRPARSRAGTCKGFYPGEPVFVPRA